MICADPNADLTVGDVICTSGVGSVYPFGISVGHVTSIEKDPYSKNTVAYIEPAVDFSSVGRVMVVAEQITEGTENE